jgi:hypothetical protein
MGVVRATPALRLPQSQSLVLGLVALAVASLTT